MAERDSSHSVKDKGETPGAAPSPGSSQRGSPLLPPHRKHVVLPGQPQGPGHPHGAALPFGPLPTHLTLAVTLISEPSFLLPLKRHGLLAGCHPAMRPLTHLPLSQCAHALLTTKERLSLFHSAPRWFRGLPNSPVSSCEGWVDG